MAECINLRQRFGGTYRTSLDPAFDDPRDPWGHQIRCRGQGVTIYPHGGELLAVEVNHRRGIARQLAQLGLRCTQDGDTEKTFIFPVSRFDEVAAVVKPRKRRQLTEAQKEAFRSRMTPEVRAEAIHKSRDARKSNNVRAVKTS
jgi:hypothetical protein